MDPLTHTLVGAGLAETPWARRTALALPTLLIAANLPDIDAVTSFVDSDLSLYHRRGWTHGVLAMAVLPLLLTGLVLAWSRWVRPRSSGDPPVRPGWILALAALGVLSHPSLDWLNTYGVRLLMPFDGRWFYGDILHIVDPWVWLLLGGTLFLARSRSGWSLGLWGFVALGTTLVVFMRFPMPAPTRGLWLAALLLLAALNARGVVPVGEAASRCLVLAGLMLFLVYTALQAVSQSAARSRIEAELPRLGVEAVESQMIGPVAGNPLARDLVVALPGEYRYGRFSWLLQGNHLTLADRSLPRGAPSEAVQAALASPQARGFAIWKRFPFYQVVQIPEGYAVYLLDARYVRARTRSFGAAVVLLDPHLKPLPRER